MFLKKIITLGLIICITSLQATPAFDWQHYQETNKKRLESGISIVAYHRSGGMLGDNLVAYLHGKWISYKYNIPLIHTPFEFSSDLVLSDAELLVAPENAQFLKTDEQGFIKTKEVCTETGIVDPQAGILYLVPWFPESLQEFERIESGGPYFFVNWEDENFLAQIRTLISPKKKLTLLELPQDKLTVAVHVRRNRNGGDLSLSFEQGDYIDPSKQYLDDYFPFKCVDDNFYIAGIKKIHELYPEKSLYVYIFTDDKNPEKMAQKYQEILNIPSITFDYIGSSHDYSSHVLEDLFSMLKFDCLVRSDSNFSLVASKLGDYKVVYSPAGYQLKNNHPVIVRAYISTKVEPIAGTQVV